MKVYRYGLTEQERERWLRNDERPGIIARAERLARARECARCEITGAGERYEFRVLPAGWLASMKPGESGRP